MIIYTRSITEIQIRFGWWNWWCILVVVHVEYMVDELVHIHEVYSWWCWYILMSHSWWVVDTWLVHTWHMVRCTCLRYLLITGWCMIDALVYGTGWLQVEVQVDALLMHGLDLLVHVYSGISHSDGVRLVLSFYFYLRVVRRGKERWLYPPSSCIRRT